MKLGVDFSVSSIILPVTLITFLLLVAKQGVSGLRCFNCHGFTNDHTDDCYYPHTAETSVRECAKDMMCEKKITRIGWYHKIERGCSASCNSRNFVWAEPSEVYCCDNENLCNSSTKNSLNIGFILCTFLTSLYILHRYLTI